MSITIFDLFSIGIGPSSSHTVGPMKAAYAFIEKLKQQELLSQVARIKIELYGSLALTGKGHATDLAILNGLAGYTARTVDPEKISFQVQQIIQTKKINLLAIHTIPFSETEDLLFHKDQLLPYHTNGIRFTVFKQNKQNLFSETYYSIGGGFIVTEAQYGKENSQVILPYPFKSAKELFTQCHQHKLTISQLVFANEQAWRTAQQIEQNLLEIADAMQACIEKGCHTQGILPGGLNVKRRAPELFHKLLSQTPHNPSLWAAVYAMAVNEENAAGGRIVTAPTNGAAGTVPAVLSYYRNFIPGANPQGIRDFLLTAGAIAILYKMGASISGAEVGCQGEVGVACSMAAGALTAVLGGSLAQIENAAEMAMEHHLGMTCDPIAGLVQIPCIERNGVAARKAINITELALLEDGTNKKISLDNIIATMLQTGRDMQSIYKETALGGLAKHGLGANVPEC